MARSLVTLVVAALGLIGCVGVAPVASAPPATAVTPSAAAPTAAATTTLAPTPTTAAPAATAPTGSGALPGGTTWGESASYLGGVEGDHFLFQCPPAGSASSIWGTDIYTSDSSVCTAAVHSGLITFAAGGNVTIEIRPGQASYLGSTRNGVTSNEYGSWGASFTFIGGATGPTPTPGPIATATAGAPSAELEALLAHVPVAMRQDCHETTSFDTGVLIAAQCLPDSLEGYVSYYQFDTVSNQRDAFLGQVDFFGDGADGTDCSVGPSQLIYELEDSPAGRLMCNDYIDGPIAIWTSESLIISGFLQLFEGTYQDLYDTWLTAGPEGEATMSPAAQSLMLHVPAAWRDACFESPSSVFTTGALATVSCQLTGGRSDIVEYTQFDTQANMDAEYQIRVSNWATDTTVQHCDTGADEEPYTVGGVNAGRVMCAPQTVGTRMDWTYDALLILSTLTDFEGSYPDMHADWQIAGPE